jgi:hypothetical protein
MIGWNEVKGKNKEIINEVILRFIRMVEWWIANGMANPPNTLAEHAKDIDRKD